MSTVESNRAGRRVAEVISVHSDVVIRPLEPSSPLVAEKCLKRFVKIEKSPPAYLTT